MHAVQVISTIAHFLTHNWDADCKRSCVLDFLSTDGVSFLVAGENFVGIGRA